jgi:uncharacterized membrane protein YecN with MAPEG domain
MPHVTLLVAGVHGLMLLLLVWPIVRTRRAQRIGLGAGGDVAMLRRIRVHANFVEYVPMGLILLALLELAGTSRTVVAALGALLLVARLLHAMGLSRSEGYSFGRMWGTLLTWTMLFAASVTAIVTAARHLAS